MGGLGVVTGAFEVTGVVDDSVVGTELVVTLMVVVVAGASVVVIVVHPLP